MAVSAKAAAPRIRARIRSSPDFPSWPGVSRPSTSLPHSMKDVDARDKPGHDVFFLQSDLAEADAVAELRVDDLLRPPRRLDLERVGAGILVEVVELEVAVVVAPRLRDRAAILHEPHLGALDTVDRAVLLGRDRAADEALGVTPQIAVPHARARAELRPHGLQRLVGRHAGHHRVLDLDRLHGARRARLLAARLLPALVDQVGVERPRLRERQLLVPPDVAVRTGVDELFLSLRLDGIDDDDAVVALADRAVARRLDAGRVIAVVAQRRH